MNPSRLQFLFCSLTSEGRYALAKYILYDCYKLVARILLIINLWRLVGLLQCYEKPKFPPKIKTKYLVTRL